MWYCLEAAVNGTPSSALAEAVPDVQDELEARPYLRNPRVHWEPESETLIILLDYEDVGPTEAGLAVNDDLSDVITATVIGLNEWDYEFRDIHLDE